MKYWLPVLLWMALIFSGSTGVMSAPRTSRIIGPILRWFDPDISVQTISRVQFFVRKTAHVTEYAVLAWLLWRALHRSRQSGVRRWRWSEAILALALAALYAASDEWHQSRVPTRQGRVRDVMLDTAGAALGLAAVWGNGRWRKHG